MIESTLLYRFIPPDSDSDLVSELKVHHCPFKQVTAEQLYDTLW